MADEPDVNSIRAIVLQLARITEQNKVIIEMLASQAREQTRHASILTEHSRYIVEHEKALSVCRTCRNFEPHPYQDRPTGETSGPFPALKGPPRAH